MLSPFDPIPPIPQHPNAQLPVTKMSIYWDGKDERGEKVASGVYWYRLQAGDFNATRRMVILK